jgi:hypothetical protein
MTEDTSPADADVTIIEVSSAPRRLTWANIKATLKTYFDGIYVLAPTCLTFLPHAMAPLNVAGMGTTYTRQYNSKTTLRLGMVVVPFAITVNKITFSVSTVGAAGTLKFTVYSEDGATKNIAHTTATISTTGEKTESLAAPVTLSAGVYYFSILPVSTADLSLEIWNTFDLTAYGGDVANEPTIEGTLTVTADTPPATITPADIAYYDLNTPMWRLDN